MAGAKSGVAAQIIQEELRETFTHCYGHALNLAAGDTIKKYKMLVTPHLRYHSCGNILHNVMQFFRRSRQKQLQEQPITLKLITAFFKSLSLAQQNNFSEMCTLLKLKDLRMSKRA